MSDKVAETKTKTEEYSGVVVSKEGLLIGTKKQKAYKPGETFTTNSKELYSSLINLKKIK